MFDCSQWLSDRERNIEVPVRLIITVSLIYYSVTLIKFLVKNLFDSKLI